MRKDELTVAFIDGRLHLRNERRPGINTAVQRPGISMRAGREHRRTGGENGVRPGGEYGRGTW
jgi:hypothetical protein